jgi:dTDP-glucose 4,6-dehydratase
MVRKMAGITSWQGKHVLVTGAGGFIGSHLVECLVEEGARVRAFVRYTSRSDLGCLDACPPEVLEEVEPFFGDLENPEAAERGVAGCDVVLHLGALIPIPYSFVHPREFVAANVIGGINMLEACRREEVERLVQISSSEVYGTAQTAPIDESHPLQAQSPYAATKIGADQLALSYWRSFGLPVVVARPFNTFGPRQSARAVIPTIITQALTRDVIELGSTTPTRDFLFVRDTARGIMACAAAPSSVEGEVINLGTGVEVTVGEVVERVLKIVGRDLPVVTTGERVRRAKEVERLLADASRPAGCSAGSRRWRSTTAWGARSSGCATRSAVPPVRLHGLTRASLAVPGHGVPCRRHILALVVRDPVTRHARVGQHDRELPHPEP